ncbi:MAG: (d)CMP kinase [Caldilineales bacterium]|nr:(d)CMP kinase [Caldilineales bacterium]
MSNHEVPQVIAIDGPAASGKSTVGEAVARRLGFLYFDTGAMYRAVTLAAIGRKINLGDETAVTALAESVHIDIVPPTVEDGRQYTVLVDQVDVTWGLRSAEVDANVSTVSAYPGVRAALSRQQRRVAKTGRVVMMGRDIGTVVFPEAPLKVYLNASAEVRARRRAQELAERGQSVDLASVLAAMIERDAIDSNRETAPLRIASGAVIVETDGLAIDEVVERIVALAHERFQ